MEDTLQEAATLCKTPGLPACMSHDQHACRHVENMTMSMMMVMVITMMKTVMMLFVVMMMLLMTLTALVMMRMMITMTMMTGSDERIW